MRYLTELPEPIQETEHVRIPMPDGCSLSARIWRPQEERPVPAVLEYIPYRKRDITAPRDALTHPYFAGHGYAAVRVDLRGSGDSEGILLDEYLETELQDGETVLQWLADQPWCDGSVGMYGKSWGGFNGLQLAARQPEALKAVIAVCATDDRYADDIHYMGGCLLGDQLSWSSAMMAHTSCPPDPMVVGDPWKKMWLERLENCYPWLIPWLEHQRRDEFWEHGSICEDFSSVESPVMIVSGWADGYSNAVFRLLEHLKAPCHGLIGPWGHKYPHQGAPGPAIGFLQYALRWWDRWLKNEPNGMDEEPALRVWMQDWVPPTFHLKERPGHWVAEDSWPSPRIEDHRLALGERRLEPEDTIQGEPVTLSVQSPLSVGLFAGRWCSFSATPDLPHDQREEDGGALVFETPPLSRSTEILGAPTVDLTVSCDQPQGMVAVRLSDVAPDDRATRVTYGLLNLSHRNSHKNPEAMIPGQPTSVRLSMNGIAHAFPAGHRIRVSVSSSYWPLAWPSPKPTRISVHTEGSRLHLPVRAPHEKDQNLSRFAQPEGSPPPILKRIQPRNYEWLVVRDLARDRNTLDVIKDEGTVYMPSIDLSRRSRTEEQYTYYGFDFESLSGQVDTERAFQRGDWSVQIKTRTVLTSDADNFRVAADLDAFLGSERVFCRSWQRKIPREFM